MVKEKERFRCWDGFGIQNGWAGEKMLQAEAPDGAMAEKETDVASLSSASGRGF